MARPFLALVVAVFNGIPLCLALLFTGLWFSGKRCQSERPSETLDDAHVYEAYGCVFCVIFVLNIAFGLHFARSIRTRSRTVGVFKRFVQLARSWPGIVFGVLIVFQLLFAIVSVSLFPRDTFCITREGALVNLGIAIAYFVIVSVIAFFVALIINMTMDCGRPYDDDDDESADADKPTKSGSTPPPTNPFADAPATNQPSAPEAEDEAPPLPVAKKTKSKEELADDEWNARLRAEKGE
jgi:hypothetical protein